VRRVAAIVSAFACALTLPAGALAARPAGHAAGRGIRHATGTVTATGWSSLTIQTAGRRMGVINALTAAATAITHQDTSYVWGGGHAEAGVASVGIKGPGYTGRARGYDCSGSVAAVLAGAGLWAAGSPVPNDAGVIGQLLQERIIARGPGSPPDEVTLYDDPGIHIFMNIDGRFFGTSDGGGGGTPKGGAGWLDDGAADAYSRAYRQYHVLPSVLHDRTTYGHSLSFLTGAAPGAAAVVQVGDRIHVDYTTTPSGTMTLQTVTFVGSATTSGTVTAVAADGSSLTLQTAGGQTTTFSTGVAPSLADGLQLGDQVQVTYTRKAGTLTARAVAVTAPPATPPAGSPPAGSPPAGPPPSGTPSSSGAPTPGWSGDGGYGGYTPPGS
jgi:hypothetical protein